MAKKTSFSDLVREPAPEILPDAKCCANCVHARNERIDSISLAHIITCKALPPAVIAIPVQDRQTGAVTVQAQARWPDLVKTEECDYFTPADAVDPPEKA